jgi:hypothetical protein
MSKKRTPFPFPDPDPNTPRIYRALHLDGPRPRNRQWEKEHQDQKVVYRGVEPKLAWKVKSMAEELSVPEGEVARRLIEHALHAYETGDLDLYPRPDPDGMRMTLYPSSDSTSIPGRSRQAKHRKHAQASWRVITTWRGFPSALKQELSVLASEAGLNIPIGELINALLRYGLQAHAAGHLPLGPIRQASGATLPAEDPA